MQVPLVDFNRQLGNSLSSKKTHQQHLDLSKILEEFKCCTIDDHIIDGQNGNEVPPFACSFCPVKGYQQVIAVVDEDGCLVLYDTNKTGKEATLRSWLAHHNAIFDVAWIPGEKKLLTASGDQTIALWDVMMAEQIMTFNGHTSSVKSLAMRPEDSGIFATGARDGNILLWDVRLANNEGCSAVGMIKSAHRRETNTGKTPSKKRAPRKLYQETQPMSVTAVIFQDQNTLISSGATDSTINIWDIRKLSKPDPVPKYNLPYAGNSLRMPGYSYLLLDSSRSRLFASCTDDTIYQFNIAGYQSKPVCTYRGHLNSTFYVRSAISPDERFILSGSSDYHAYIWSIDRPLSSPIQLKGNMGDVTSVAWCPSDITKIVTLSDDSTVKFWRLNRGEESSDYAYVGRAQRAHRDIGTSVEMPMSTLKQASVLPKAAIKKFEPLRTIPSFECTYPTIKAWVTNFNKIKSPMKYKSPRKLPTISPRKILISPMKSKTQISYGDSLRPKRKLEMDHTPNKRLCGLVTPEKQKLPLSPKNFTPSKTLLRATPVSQKIDFQSPTSDLPNYVFDNRLRNPIPGATNKENTPSCRKGCNELLQRASPKVSSLPKSGPSSPCTNQKNASSGRGSILFYFSPSEKSKKQ